MVSVRPFQNSFFLVIGVILIYTCFIVSGYSQAFEVDGEMKISTMQELNGQDSIVVWTSDGKLAIRNASTISGGSGGSQTLSISNNIISLTDGGSVELPPDAVNDSDADPSNELQDLSFNGDTIFIEDKNFIVVPGLKNITLLNITVQERLNRGSTPNQIYQLGFPLDSLYGKLYSGGLIFYIDPLDTLAGVTGLVADLGDININGDLLHPWGCMATNPIAPPMGRGIGDGSNNTTVIAADACSVAGDAVVLAEAHTTTSHQDWFLPSLDELEAMYHNIGQGASGVNNNIGNFDASDYWTSTPSSEVEEGEAGTWKIDFSTGTIRGFRRLEEIRVRAVRAF